MHPTRSRPPVRQGAALVVCLFIVTVISVMVVGMLDSLTSELAAVRNSRDYEQAQYLAGAGVHHALAELEADSGFTGTLAAVEFPTGSGNYYTATVAAGDPGEIVVTGEGTIGSGPDAVVRHIQVTVSSG